MTRLTLSLPMARAFRAGLKTQTRRVSPPKFKVGDGDALKTYKDADLPSLIRRVLGEAAFTALADPTSAAKVERDRRRSELNHRHQDAEAALHQARDNLAAIEAQIAAFDRENP